jgi:hypothetical protein
VFGKKKEKEGTEEKKTVEKFDSTNLNFKVIELDVKKAVRDYTVIKSLSTEQESILKKNQNLEGQLKEKERMLIEEKKKLEAERKRKVEVKPEGEENSRLLLWIILLFLLSALIAGGFFWWFYEDKSLLLNDQNIDQVIDQEPLVAEPVVTIVEILPGRDADSDGLTDAEERLYGTDLRNPDTDEDSFLDGNEVFHLFDPIELSPAALSLSPYMTNYQHTGLNQFRVMFPRAWTAQSIQRNQVDLVDAFENVDGMTIRTLSTSALHVQIVPIQEDVELIQKFAEMLEIKEISGDPVRFVSKAGYIGYQSSDKRYVAVESNEKWIFFEYQLNSDRFIEYLMSFQMMINSFIIE